MLKIKHLIFFLLMFSLVPSTSQGFFHNWELKLNNDVIRAAMLMGADVNRTKLAPSGVLELDKNIVTLLTKINNYSEKKRSYIKSKLLTFSKWNNLRGKSYRMSFENMLSGKDCAGDYRPFSPEIKKLRNDLNKIKGFGPRFLDPMDDSHHKLLQKMSKAMCDVKNQKRIESAKHMLKKLMSLTRLMELVVAKRQSDFLNKIKGP